MRIVHRHHPLSGHAFDLAGVVRGPVEQRVLLVEPGGDRVFSVPMDWTDVQAPDPFLVVSAGRALFRPADLLVLVGLVRQLSGGGVKEILP